jgi:hypothetical protein
MDDHDESLSQEEPTFDATDVGKATFFQLIGEFAIRHNMLDVVQGLLRRHTTQQTHY